MAKNKFYAVRKGFETGVFFSWDEARKNVQGFPGAEYKGFSNIDDAYAFMEVKNEEVKNDVSLECLDFDNIQKIYTDGSYCSEKNSIGYGVVFVSNDGDELFSDCGRVPINNTSETNVAGEIYAVIRAVNLAIANNFKEVCICHDYEGVAKWLNGDYKAKNPLAKRYVEYMEKHSDKVKVYFKHIKGHSGNKWNNRADTLASLGCSL